MDALNFVDTTPPDVVISFWGEQLSRTAKLVKGASPFDSDWGNLAPSSLDPQLGGSD